MKILLLNQTFYPDVVSTAQHLSELATALVERGHQVTVVTGRRAYDHPDKTFAARETWRGVRIFRVFSTRFGKRAKWHRAVDFASFIVSSCARLLFLSRHDVVVALTTPPLISFIGAWRAKLWRAKFCYWVMDMNPDEAIAAGWLRADSFAAKMLERMSRFSFRRAGWIIALDRFMRDRIVAKGIAPEKIAVLPPWSQDHDVRFDVAGREQFRQQHGLSGKYVVMYSGNHSPVHPLDTLMQAAEKLQTDASIVFCFVGGGSEFKRVHRWAADGKRTNVLCLPYQPLAQLSASLSAADAHVVVMGEAMLGLVHPCKIYNMLAVGAPVIYIGPQPSHVTEILGRPEAGHPWCSVRHGEGEQLAERIRHLREVLTNRQAPSVLTAEFAKDVLLPRMIAGLERADG
ncbi:MAG TPA: glycosyltransferase family 4 protein [Verrucomicrobiae bacterium]|nr:glycosyltransferase family 4 protein [Verrucomicrobiae bacterium]